MKIESIENFLSERTVWDVTASESQSRLYREYTAYCIFRDHLSETGRKFGAYLKAGPYRKIRGFRGRNYIQGVRLTDHYVKFDY